ncbi:MAG: hypothetical protein H8E81_05190 [Deltaproteobacteria bacterium]|nr:hypothetical protein [Deltaproteobacteria bacterium]
MRASLVAEELGIPTASIVVTMFIELSHFIASSYGVPEAKVVEWSGAIDVFSRAQLLEMAEKTVVDHIVEALTKGASGGGLDG